MQINVRLQECDYELTHVNQWKYHMSEGAVTTAPDQAGTDCGCRTSKHETSAREILDRRYASGEITREQYEHIKQDLRATTKIENGCC